jgi:hypothetical protein
MAGAMVALADRRMLIISRKGENEMERRDFLRKATALKESQILRIAQLTGPIK